MIEWIDLFVTDACNMKCKYCFHPTGSNFLSTDLAVSYLKDLMAEMSDKCIINFFGGEPLLNQEAIRAVVDFVKSIGKKYCFSISTNGLVFERDFFLFMKENNFHIQISMDGAKKTQDENRGDYDAIRENVGKMKELGLELSARMTCDTGCMDDLSSNMKHLHEIGFNSIMHQPVMDNSWNEESIDSYAKQFQEISSFFEEHRDCRSVFLNNSKLSRVVSLNDPTCKAGKTLIAIDVSGDVYPCHRFASNKNYKLGTTKSFHRGIFSKITRKNMEKCFSCDAKQTCHMCMAANYEVNGSITETIDNYCNLIRKENQLMKKQAATMRNKTLNRIEEGVDNLLSLVINLCKIELERNEKNG